MKITNRILTSSLLALGVLAGCSKADPGVKPDPSAGGALVRVKVPEAKVEVAIPANMVVAEAKAGSFRVVEKGKNPAFDGMLLVILPVGPMGGFAPPDAKEVKVDKDEKGADGSRALEGSYKNAYQTLYVANYDYPVGKEWLGCHISAAKPERRDEVAKLCRGLAPKPL